MSIIFTLQNSNSKFEIEGWIDYEILFNRKTHQKLAEETDHEGITVFWYKTVEILKYTWYFTKIAYLLL